MSRRRRIPLAGLPVGGALGVTLTGCGPAAEGDWLLVSRDGEEAVILELREGERGPYEYFYRVVLTMNRDRSGWLTYSYGASYEGAERSYTYDLASRYPFRYRESGGGYQIVLDEDRGSLSCQLTELLDCETESGEGWSFEPF